MKSDLTEIRGILDEMRAQLAALAGRVEKLEAAAAPPPPRVQPKPQPAPAPPPVVETITEEELLAISAVVAAHLGERVRIRQIRVISSPAWAQQGRVSIQASHRLH